jgi:hypothetical protein
MIETFVGIGIWVAIFLVWYARTYPQKFKDIIPIHRIKMSWPRLKKPSPVRPRPESGNGRDYKGLVETVESICARDRMSSSDAASMVLAVKRLMDIEPSTGQIWEAYALDSLESAVIICDECRIPVEKTVKKTGVRIRCAKCQKWLALRNSKVTVIDPTRSDLEDWER